MSLFNRFLGGVGSYALMAPDDGGGAGGGDGGTGGDGRTGAPAAGATKVEAGKDGGGADGGAAARAAAAAGAAGAGDGGAPAGNGAGAGKDGGASKTLAGGAEGTAAAAATPAKFPENWREELAGGDKAALKALERYASPKAVYDSLKQLQTRISAGELKAPPAPLAENAKPEEVAAWRKENGLPETPAAFVTGLKLPEGMTPGKQDEPLLSSFAETAMKNNWDQGTFNKAVDWYYQMSDQLSAQREEADGDFHTKAIQELRGEWGSEWKQNQTAIGGLINLFPEEIRAPMLLARMPDGSLLGDNPAVNRALLMLAKEINPAATILPAAAGAGLSGVNTRITEIEGIMRNPATRDQYWKGEGGARMQGELRQLYEARDKMKERAA